MSMLAEPRFRQKWSHDPRNTNWSNDKTKFGYQMLTKMGWSEGNGLGLNLSGNVSHIKVNKRGSNAGVGLKKSHDDDWISHQDDFNALLNSLNGNPTSETTSPVEKMRASRHRYTKFVKSKDLSNASIDDMACIFGQRGKSTTGVREEAKDSNMNKTEDAPKEEELSVKTVESTLSMNDYFAMKMAALKQKNVLADSPLCINDIEHCAEKVSMEEVCNGEAVKKKKKKREGKKGSFVGEETLVDSCQPVKKKKKKKVNNAKEENPGPLPCYDLKKEDNDSNSEDCQLMTKNNQTKDSDDACPISFSCLETTCDDGNAVDHFDSENVNKKKKKKKLEAKHIEGPGSLFSPEDIKVLNDIDLADDITKKKKTKKSKECNKVDNFSPCSEIGGDEKRVDSVIEKPSMKKKRKLTDENIMQTWDQLTEERRKKKKKKKNKEDLSTK